MAEQEQGFKVTDRRASHTTETTPTPEAAKAAEAAQPQATTDAAAQTGASTPQAPPAEQPAQTPEFDQNIPLPEANLLTLIFSLYTHTQICLGLLPDPSGQQPQQDLNQAKYNIDMLTMLKHKTAGNLTTEEEQTLESVLYEVRMAYVGVRK